MASTLDGYYDRTDPTKTYERHLFRAGYGLQSAELNEIQDAGVTRIRSIGDALFKDGDIIKDCTCLVDTATGAVTVGGGAIYLRGMVRGVTPAKFNVPTDRALSIGVRVLEKVVTELEDPGLRDPAVGTRNFQEPGAARLQVSVVWGWDGDGKDGDFYAIYSVENGFLRQKAPPPQMDAVTTALARYDRDSAGGNYVINGFSVSATFDAATGKMVTMLSEGRARVNGFGVEMPRSIRLVEDMDRDLEAVQAEPRTFAPDANGKMRIVCDHTPVVSVDQVRITAAKSAAVTHGNFSGAKDPLPDNAVLSIIAVNQGGTWDGSKFTGGTTYVNGTDYKLTAGQVDWSLPGTQPAPGSSYSVAYQYQTSPQSVDALDGSGFTISGAVPGTLVTTDYKFALPRTDALVLDADGRVTRVKGVASQYASTAPSAPSGTLKVASIRHNWSGDPQVTQDAVVAMPMDQLQNMRGMVLDLYDLVAQERLRNSIGLAEPAAKRGVFVDPLNNDNLRDSGIAQTAAILNGELMLPIDAAISQVGQAITVPTLLDYTLEPLIEQPSRTGSMAVNPYQAFAPVPAKISLSPAVDAWTETRTSWASPITQRFLTRLPLISWVSTSTSIQVISSSSQQAEFLRPITVQFTISGFGANEQLQQLSFDGLTVTPEAI